MANPHEDAARARKVAALVATLDAACIDKDNPTRVDPHRCADDIVGMLLCWSDAEWNALAIAARKNPPSLTARAHVIEMYRARAAAQAQKAGRSVRLVTVNGVEVRS